MKHHQDLFYTPPIQDGINDSVQEFMQIIYASTSIQLFIKITFLEQSHAEICLRTSSN